MPRARLVVITLAIGLTACGGLLRSGQGDATAGGRTLHVVVHNAVERNLVLAFNGTGTAGFSQIGESLVAPCAVSIFTFALPNEWQLRIDGAPALASGEQADVYREPAARENVTLVVRADQGGFHYDRLRAGPPTGSETPGLIADCP
jgi:hypothetical protein